MLLLIIFLVPLFFSRILDVIGIAVPFLYTNLVFNLPKAVLFSILLEIAALLWIIRVLLLKKIEFSIPSKVFLLLITGLGGSFVLATLFSEIPWFSFFGQYEKSQGLLMQFHYLAFLFLIVSVFRKEDLAKIFFTITLSAFFVAFYAIFQALGFDPLQTQWASETLNDRVFSTFGHPNYLAYWLLFTLPVSMYMLARLFFLRTERSVSAASKNTNRLKESAYHASSIQEFLIKLLVAFSVLFQIITLFLTGSRAAILAIILSIALALILDLFFQKRKRAAVLFIVSVILGGILFISFSRNTSFFRLDEANTSSVKSRLVLWQDTFAMFLDRPILGYGLDTYSIYFPRFKSQELLYLEDWQQNADRSHNLMLDSLQSTGLIGTFFMITLFFWLMYCAIKLLSSREDKGLGAVVFIMVVSYFIANLFGFSVAAHDVYFWLFVGLVLLLYGKRKLVFFLGWSRISTLAFIPLLVITCIFQIRLYWADHLFFEGVNHNNREQIIEAASLYPFHTSYLLSAAKVTDKTPDRFLQQLSFLTRGIDYPSRLLAAQLAVKNGELEQARQLFSEAVVDFPHVPVFAIEWAKLEKEHGNYSRCVEIYENLLKIVDLPYVKSFQPVYDDVAFCKKEMTPR